MDTNYVRFVKTYNHVVLGDILSVAEHPSFNTNTFIPVKNLI